MGWQNIQGAGLGVILIASILPTAAQAEFVNVAEEAGVALKNVRGAGWADYDGDGCPDLLVALKSRVRLFHNACDGSGSFADVTRAARIPGPSNAWMPAWADYDGDGDLDVYIAAGGSEYGSTGPGSGNPNKLYSNNGDATFTDVTSATGVGDPGSSTGASWADFDNDGDLDLFVANRWRVAAVPNSFDSLYRNNGDGTFTNVASQAGVAGKAFRQSFMGAWIDYDGNGTQDLYVAVDFGPDILYRNDGNGSFTDVSEGAGVRGPAHGMGIAVADLNADGCTDLLSTNNTQDDDAEHGPSVLYMNNCDGTFHNAAREFGILDRAVVEWGPNFVDWDNDADLDLAVTAGGMLTSGEPNVLYENLCEAGVCAFADVTDREGVTDVGAAFASAWADYDNDGDLDWFVANTRGEPSALFRNDGAVGAYLKIRLAGRGGNRRGIGANVELEIDGVSQFALIQSGKGYASDEEQQAFFGLGPADHADRVSVFWPSGAQTTIENVSANQIITLTEPRTE